MCDPRTWFSCRFSAIFKGNNFLINDVLFGLLQTYSLPKWNFRREVKQNLELTPETVIGTILDSRTDTTFHLCEYTLPT